MTPTPQREEALFQAAAQLPGSERAAFLQRECKGDGALRERLQALLAVYELGDSFMTDPTQEFPAAPHTPESSQNYLAYSS